MSIHPFVNTLVNFANYIIKFEELLCITREESEEKTINEINRTFPEVEKLLNAYQHLPVSDSNGIFISKIYDNKLLNEIKKFASQTAVDYHPGMSNKVRDIVHPSLYPLISDQQSGEKKDKTDFWKRPYEDSKYQWLPSEFAIDNAGKCSIKSYINNLPIEQKQLYSLIENAFNSVLSKFEQCWEFINHVDLLVDDVDEIDLKPKNKKMRLHDRTLQVITKIVQISLKDEPLLGSWHVEGMSHENIIATATITLEQDETFNAELMFKRIYSKNEAEHLVYNIRQDTPYEIKEEYNKIHIPLGKHNITTGDVLVFPNSHIHKIDMTGSGTRTILVFWLVNPDIRITSTKDIPQQTYNIEQAYEHRLSLMKERTVYKSTFNQRDLNLCEH